MVTIINGEDERRVTRGAFETYFKDIGYEIKSNKVAKPNKIIDNTEVEEAIEEVVEEVVEQPVDEQVAQQPTDKQNNKYGNTRNNKNRK